MITKEQDKFLRCDLHLHSSSCYSRTYSEEAFISKLRSADLDVISITDHNIIDIDMYQKINDDTEIKAMMIGGAELNVLLSSDEISNYNLTINESAGYFHGIIWFNISDIDKMWEALKKYMREKIPELADIDNLNYSEISAKMEAKCFELDKLQEYIKNIEYYFIFHENKGDRNLSDYLKNGVPENESYKEKLFYYNNHLGLDGSSKNKKVTAFFENINTVVSNFLFSDAKTIDEIGTKYSWINFDGNFENLILAISDPESRVQTSDDTKISPQKNMNSYLESIKFNVLMKQTGGEQAGKIVKEIFFSAGLNGIIGSRGSGKTMLGSILANTDISNYKEYIDINSIEYKLKDSNYSKDTPKCKYLKQNTLLNIYEAGDYMQLDFIENNYDKLLKDKQKKCQDIVTKVIAILAEEKEQILEFCKKYPTTKNWDFLINKPQNDILLKNILDYNFPNNISEKDNILEKIDNIDDSLNKVKENVSIITFNNKFEESKEMNKKVSEYIEAVKKLVESIRTQKKGFSKYINDYDYSKMNKRNSYLNLLKDITDETNETNDNSAKIFNEQYTDIKEYFSDLYILRKSIYNNFNKIKGLHLTIFEDDINKELTLDSGEKILIYTNIENTNALERTYTDQFKNNTDSFVDHITQIVLNSNNAEKLKERFNGNKYKNKLDMNAYITQLYQNLMDFFKKFNEIPKLKIEYKGKELDKYSPGKRSEILLEIFLYDGIVGNEEYKYIILDQPEDNLDTDTIVKKLVDKIKKMKLKKQFFIISHSAPVIVNADSDIIVCSEEKENCLDYCSGRINHKDMKQRIVKILDGGEKNLKMRLHKYDFRYEEEL